MKLSSLKLRLAESRTLTKILQQLKLTMIAKSLFEVSRLVAKPFLVICSEVIFHSLLLSVYYLPVAPLTGNE